MPKTYQDIVYPSAAAAALVHNLVTNRMPFPANGKNGLLIYGPSGTGKSTLAQLLVQDIPAARGGRPVFAVTHPIITTGGNNASLLQSMRKKAETLFVMEDLNLFILHEVDLLGNAAMRSMKSVMDMPCTMFVMTTNDISAVENGVKSRSHLIDMTAPPAAQWLNQARQHLATLGVTKPVADQELLPLIAGCHGDVREILTQLQMLALDLAA